MQGFLRIRRSRGEDHDRDDRWLLLSGDRSSSPLWALAALVTVLAILAIVVVLVTR